MHPKMQPCGPGSEYVAAEANVLALRAKCAVHSWGGEALLSQHRADVAERALEGGAELGA